MPLLRYFLYVGGALLSLLFFANAYLPQVPSVETSGPRLPVIHLYAEHRGPQRLVYDTSAPLVSAAPAAKAEANVSGNVREAYAQLPPPDAGKVSSADAKKPPPRRIARRHSAPPLRMVYQQPQFGWFGPQPRFW